MNMLEVIFCTKCKAKTCLIFMVIKVIDNKKPCYRRLDKKARGNILRYTNTVGSESPKTCIVGAIGIIAVCVCGFVIDEIVIRTIPVEE